MIEYGGYEEIDAYNHAYKVIFPWEYYDQPKFKHWREIINDCNYCDYTSNIEYGNKSWDIRNKYNPDKRWRNPSWEEYLEKYRRK